VRSKNFSQSVSLGGTPPACMPVAHGEVSDVMVGL